MARANLLDRLVTWVAPEAGLRRARARVRHDLVSKVMASYDGATLGRRSKGWRAVSTDVNGEIAVANGRLRDVARDMVRNNEHAGRAVAVIAANVVGTGIVPSFKTADGVNAPVAAEILAHLNSTDCDADGRHNLYGLERLACRTMVESGEALVRRRPRRAADGLRLPFQLQVIEPDFLDTGKEGPTAGGGYILQGIEFNAFGQRTAYWLFSDHPGSAVRAAGRRTESRPVPASEVIHLYRVDRPGQVRGVTWLAPVVLSLRDFHDYEDAQLMRQKIAACFAAFIEDAEPPETPATEQSGRDPAWQEGFEPGMIQYLPGGKKVTFATPPSVGDYGSTSRVTLQKVAVGMGISYEALTGDLAGVNFSSGRMGWLEFQRNIDDWRWNTIVPCGLDTIASWCLQAATIRGLATEGVTCSWTAPRREMIDPSKEIAAKKDEVRAGLKSWSAAIRESGDDPAEVLAEIKADFDAFDAAGVKVESDPRVKAAAAPPDPAGPPANPNDDKEPVDG